MTAEALLVRTSADIAMLCFFAAITLRLLARPDVARPLWALGVVVFVGHVWAAFAIVHAWSHQAAVQHTAVRVNEVMGWPNGDGIYVSYVFTLLWIVDAVWWLVWPKVYERRGLLLDLAVYGFFAFMVFFGTIVFESGFARWLGVAGFTVIGMALTRNVYRRPGAGSRSDER